MAECQPLPRRRDPDARQEAWLINYGDIHVGTIALRSGVGGIDHWTWSCGFYPGCHASECTSGSAASFEAARTAFEAA